jgi:hypothetical protein
MADNGVWVESVKAALLSEIEMVSARMMKNAYLPYPLKNRDEEPCVPLSQPVNILQADEVSGPNAIVYITKISTQTPGEEIKKLLKNDPGREEILRNYDFYTILLITSIQMDDPSTTRFINATLEFVFPHGIKILDYSPKEKGIVIGIIESGGAGIAISQSLDFLASSLKTPKVQPGNPGNRFEIGVGPEVIITCTYSKKSGYSVEISFCDLLEYQVMLKNEHEVYGEVYPPMPPQDTDSTGKKNLAVFSFIIQTPRNSPPEIQVNIDGRVKGNLWGVIPLKGSVVLTKSGNVS